MVLVRYFLLLITVVLHTGLPAQESNLYNELTKGDFLYLNNDRILKDGQFKLRHFLESWTLLDVDKNKLNFREVKFLQQDRKYFAMYKSSVLVRRVESGYYDLFETAAIIPSTFSYSQGSGKSRFYTHEFGEIKQVTYENLIEEVGQEYSVLKPYELDAVLEFIEKGKRKEKQRISILVGSAAFIIGGATIGFNGVKEGKEIFENIGLGLTLVGLGTGIVTLLKRKDTHYWRALKEFNQYHRSN